MQDELNRKVAALRDKEAIIELVEEEVGKIKEGQEAERRAMQDKEAVLEQLTMENEQLQREHLVKQEELRLLLSKLDDYKRGKDEEVLRLRKKLQSAEEDIKVLLVEQERQRRLVGERLKGLNEMFK